MATFQDPTGVIFRFWKAGEHVGSQVTAAAGAPAWFELYAADAGQARDFYAALLGASVERMPGGLEYYVLQRGGQELAGIMQIDSAWGDLRPQWMTYFGVANADDALAAITGNGGRAMSGVDDTPFGRMAAAMDPSGAFFKIVEAPAG